MEIPTKEDICTFVKNACSSTSNSELYLCTIDSNTAQKIKKIIPITLTDYDVVITEEICKACTKWS